MTVQVILGTKLMLARKIRILVTMLTKKERHLKFLQPLQTRLPMQSMLVLQVILRTMLFKTRLPMLSMVLQQVFLRTMTRKKSILRTMSTRRGKLLLITMRRMGVLTRGPTWRGLWIVK